MRIKKLVKNIRIIILFVVIVLALVAIQPNFGVEGIAIRSVIRNSSANFAGIQSPNPQTPPMAKERIIAVNNKPVETVVDYYDFISTLSVGRSFTIRTNKGLYKLTTKPIIVTEILNETEEKIIQDIVYLNETNVTQVINKTIIVNKTLETVVGMEDIGLSVYPAPTTNIRKGLDLQGGTRVLLQPEIKIDKDDMDLILENMKERLNVYGLTDVIVREAGDLSGNQYISVEIAGANEEEVRELLAKQGKFEAKIGNVTIFRGGSDVTYVCRSADCAGIDPNRGCSKSSDDEWFCRFRFAISLNPEAAKRQGAATRDLEVITTDGDKYLSQKLELFLDDNKVDELNIGADLQGSESTDIAISGPGFAATQQEAIFVSLKNMKRLQTILITGSLPIKLDIVKTDAISPVLGEEFVKNAILVGLLAILSVVIIVYARYRRYQIVLPMAITLVSEVIILLGLASLIGWNLDLASIAGIIIAVGTGVDHQIVITDETLRGEKQKLTSWSQRMKNAFFIIMAAYFTTVVAMLPLWFAGAGLLKGFAVTTIFGITLGVFITRPAFASMIEILLKE